jgi:competence ComEA-like helix-hairpin-helix protein
MRQILKFVITVSLLIADAPAQTAVKLPEGQGKELLDKVCSKCHELEGILRSRNTKERWSNIVDEMISRGADATDPEIEQIVGYLAKNFGRKVNVNKAAAGDLVAILSISKEIAAAIVSYREKNGAFKGWDDLKKVPGIDPKPLEEKKDLVEF